MRVATPTLFLITFIAGVCHGATFSYIPPGKSDPVILLQADFTIDIKAFNGKGDHIATFSEGSESKDINLFGVHGVRSFLQLGFSNGINWGLTFNKQSDEHVFLERMVQFIPSKIFPQFHDISDYFMYYDQGKTDLHSASKSYTCDRPVTSQYTSQTDDHKNVHFKVSVTVSKLKVQAFNVEYGEFSSSEQCSSGDIITPPTKKPTTATPTKQTPTPSGPSETTTAPYRPPNTYIVRNKSGNETNSCISVEGKFGFEIAYDAYISPYATMKKTINIAIPEEATVGGVCHLKTGFQQLVVKFFDNWVVEFLFAIDYANSYPYESGDSQSKMEYSVKSVTLKYNINNPNFPSAYTSKGSTYHVSVSKHEDLPRKKASNGFYQCDTPKRLQLNENVAMVMRDVRVKAFISDQDIGFYGTPDICDDDVTDISSQPVVVVVGCLLVSVSVLVFVAVSTIVIVKCSTRNRRKRRRGYLRL